MFVGKVPRLRQLVEVFEKYQDPVLAAIKIDSTGTEKYGVIEGTEIEPGVVQVSKLIEKPGPKKTKSRLGAVGGYIVTPDIFDALEKTALHAGELWFTDAIERLMRH